MLWRSRSWSAAMRDFTARLFWRFVRRIALTHGLLEAVLCRKPLEVIALRRMARDAVEEHSQRLRRVQALRVERLVHEQLHHHELVDRRERGALHELLEAVVQLRRRRRRDREAPIMRGAAVDEVAGEQQPLGALVAHAEGPQ